MRWKAEADEAGNRAALEEQILTIVGVEYNVDIGRADAADIA